MHGGRVKENSYLREVDGVPLGALSGSSSMEIYVPGKTRNSIRNQFYEAIWRLEDLLDVSGVSMHWISSETRAEFETLRSECDAANVGAPHGTKVVVSLSLLGLYHREAALQSSSEVVNKKEPLDDL